MAQDHQKQPDKQGCLWLTLGWETIKEDQGCASAFGYCAEREMEKEIFFSA